MKLSKNFTLEELTITSTGINNTPFKDDLSNLQLLVDKVLQPLRDMYGKSIYVSSGYRNPIVNRKVGGSVNSSHMFGRAADINTGSLEENKKLFDLIKNNFNYRQLIWEKGTKEGPAWVHVEYNEKDNKKQILIYDGKKYING